MDTRGDTPSLDELLTPPASFVREHYEAFLFTPFSRKLRRRVYLYTPNAYDLWVRLESNPLVVKYNERVTKLPISICEGVAKNGSPRAISVDNAREVTVHTFEDDVFRDEISASGTLAWSNWARIRGFRHMIWNPHSLRSNPVELENLKRLLRFVSVPGVVPNYSLEQSLLAELRGVRRLTYAKLIELFPLSDPAEVAREITRMIIDKKVFSDINRNPFSMITEVSVHRGLETE